MLRTVSQVTTDLAVAFPKDQLQTIDKGQGPMSYIPWDVVVRVLDRIFTPFGWSAEPAGFSGDPSKGVYLAAVKLTVSVRDEESGEVVSVSRCGFGRGTAPATAEDRKAGLAAASNLQTHDTAAAAAGSDALVRASKLLGDALGLSLYGQKRQPRTDTATSRPAAAPASDGFVKGRPSAKQLSTLLNAGYTRDEVDGMDFKTWKANLDYLFANNFQRPGAASPAASAEEEDDLPF